MKTGTSGFGSKYCLLGTFLCLGLWLALESANGQTTPASSERDFALKVAVEEVRIDAVVLDKKGRQIKDLTADDFEIYQDGKPQKISSCVYINEDQGPSRDSSKMSILTPSPMLPKSSIRRTIAFVIDDLSMDFDHFYYTQMAIEKFVETQMQSGDLAVIFQTSGGALLQFSSDKRVLLSRIKNLRWKGGTGGLIGCGPSGCGVASTLLSRPRYINTAVDAETSGRDAELQRVIGQIRSVNPRRDALTQAQYDYRQRLLESQIAIIQYCIRTLQDMPGRKSLLFMSSVITLPAPPDPRNDRDLNYFNLNRFRRLFNEVADEALRAGVVVQTLDMKGLTSEPAQIGEEYIPVSKKTGGIIVENSNFFLKGIGPAEEELKGYYLISFIPPTNSFDENRREVYRRIKVKVKRHGTEVHSRDGYFGTAHPSTPASVAEKNTLEQAIFSPFLYSDLKLDLTSGYAYAPTPGYFLRSWLQLDGKDLNFTDEQDGTHSLSLELATLTSDSDGFIQDSKGLQYRFKANDEDLSRIRKEGVDFNIYLPVKNSGDYYVRTAIRDRASGKIGSAYQFLQIPDLKKRRLSLSSIFVINQNEEASDIKSGNIEGNSNASDSTRKWHEAKSPALRSYLPGEGFDYMAMVYNAPTREGLEPKLESQITIFKDGKKFFEGNREDVDLHRVGDLGRIPIMKRLSFDRKMDEGAYLLQLTIKDRQNKNQSRVASQAIDFEIRRKQ